MALPGCCAGGPELLQIWVTPQMAATDRNCDWETPVWGETTMVVSGTNAIVLWDGDVRSASRPVEVFDSAGARLELASDFSEDAHCAEGCPSERTVFHLPTAPGDYTLVHRESQGNGKPVWLPMGGDPWTTFEGERALVTTLRVVP